MYYYNIIISGVYLDRLSRRADVLEPELCLIGERGGGEEDENKKTPNVTSYSTVVAYIDAGPPPPHRVRLAEHNETATDRNIHQAGTNAAAAVANSNGRHT